MGDPNAPTGGRRALSYYLMHGIYEFYLLLFHFIIFLTFVVKKNQPLPFSFCVHSRFFLLPNITTAVAIFFYSRFLCVEWVFRKKTKKKVICMYVFSRRRHESLWVPRSEGETYTIYFPAACTSMSWGSCMRVHAGVCALRNMG